MEKKDESDTNILNENNKSITKQYIETTLAKFNIPHKVKNLKIFQTAMTHTSYVINPQKKTFHHLKATIPLQKTSYERLEFLGDSVIHMVLADYLYNRYSDQHEGFMTK